jgi:hypothetical protein
VHLTLRNPRRAQHTGGLWELGDRGSVLLSDAAFVFRDPSGRAIAFDVRESTVDEPFRCEPPLEIFQASSGGLNWLSRAHLDRTNTVPMQFRGFRLRWGAGSRTGLRATPTVGAVTAEGVPVLAVSVPQFWENFPYAIEGDGQDLSVRFFPRQHGRPFELQGGEQKTHTIHGAAGAGASNDALDWSVRPPIVTLRPEQWSLAGASLLPSPLPTRLPANQQQLVDLALDGTAGFLAKRETADEYGWRNFGDMPADHEAVRSGGGTDFISHYNNQYDGIWGCWLQFMRTGEARWRQLACDLAAHVADIDVYHTSCDKSAYNHGMFWHTFHYIDAGLSTHRGYPKAPGVWGGGPSSEHNYTSGLLLQYYVTGEERFREVVLELAQWVLTMDDGQATPFKWIYRGPTGLASATASADYHGPGRGGAYSINTLLNAHQLTEEPRYLAAAERLLRRCIHPRDDIEARELRDAERRWSYTVFLQVIGRYLSVKEELGQIDGAFSYARDSLLAYAGWMAKHESPYFERAESLEFVTETWVAQELRKSDVFVLAARHSPENVREAFLERARFFHDYAIQTLRTMPTCTFTRPVVLALSNGLLLPAIAEWGLPAAVMSAEAVDPGRPRAFYTQKAIAFRRLRRGAFVGVAAFILVAAFLWSQWR